MSWDAARKNVDDFRLEWNTFAGRRNACMKGGKQETCFELRGNKLVIPMNPWLFGMIESDGDIVWTHGYTSRLESQKCHKRECKITIDDFVGPEVEFFNTDTGAAKSKPFTLRNIKVASGKGQICTENMKICMTRVDNNGLFSERLPNKYAWLERDNTIRASFHVKTGLRRV